MTCPWRTYKLNNNTLSALSQVFITACPFCFSDLRFSLHPSTAPPRPAPQTDLAARHPTRPSPHPAPPPHPATRCLGKGGVLHRCLEAPRASNAPGAARSVSRGRGRHTETSSGSGELERLPWLVTKWPKRIQNQNKQQRHYVLNKEKHSS